MVHRRAALSDRVTTEQDCADGERPRRAWPGVGQDRPDRAETAPDWSGRAARGCRLASFFRRAAPTAGLADPAHPAPGAAVRLAGRPDVAAARTGRRGAEPAGTG